MLKSFRRFFDEFVTVASPASTAGQSHEHQLQLATSALLIEMVRADFDMQETERDHVVALLIKEFNLSPQEAAQLAALGEDEVRESVSLYEFTRAIDTALSQSDKIRVIEMLWQVAYVDGALDKYEEALMRKLADLLHLSHRQLMQAKHRVLEARGVSL